MSKSTILKKNNKNFRIEAIFLSKNKFTPDINKDLIILAFICFFDVGKNIKI
jgi:hypothetical protein